MDNSDMAIAYAVKKHLAAKKKKMAEGGEVEPKDDVADPDPKKASEFEKGATSSGLMGGPSQWVKNIREGLKMAKGGMDGASDLDDLFSQDSDESMNQMADDESGMDDFLSSGDSENEQEESDDHPESKMKSRMMKIMSRSK